MLADIVADRPFVMLADQLDLAAVPIFAEYDNIVADATQTNTHDVNWCAARHCGSSLLGLGWARLSGFLPASLKGFVGNVLNRRMGYARFKPVFHFRQLLDDNINLSLVGR